MKLLVVKRDLEVQANRGVKEKAFGPKIQILSAQRLFLLLFAPYGIPVIIWSLPLFITAAIKMI